ncbi:hypothetical protein BC833DRAFT_581522 [Globomyces pollinis-pini]|nr:hypothetical protein BC833DRAFT_581522 [Globomyces pollinis-pini]
MDEQVEEAFKDLVQILLDIKPNDPISFSAEYFLHVAHGSGNVFKAMKHISASNTNSPMWINHIGKAFEILSNGGTGISQKDVHTFFDHFVIRSEPIDQALKQLRLKLTDHEVQISFQEFEQIVLYYYCISDIVNSFSKTYRNQSFPTKTADQLVMQHLYLEEKSPSLGIRNNIFQILKGTGTTHMLTLGEWIHQAAYGITQFSDKF